MKVFIATLAAAKQASGYTVAYNNSSTSALTDDSSLTTIDGTVYSIPSISSTSTVDLSLSIATNSVITTSDYNSSISTVTNSTSTSSNITSTSSGDQITTTIPNVIDKTITVDTSKIVTITSCSHDACETNKYYT